MKVGKKFQGWDDIARYAVSFLGEPKYSLPPLSTQEFIWPSAASSRGIPKVKNPNYSPALREQRERERRERESKRSGRGRGRGRGIRRPGGGGGGGGSKSKHRSTRK